MTAPENWSQEPNPTPPPPPPPPGPEQGYQPPQSPYGFTPMPGAPAAAQYAQPGGPLGHARPTGLTILLAIVTFGIWGLVWWYQVHEEMRQHSGQGVGGVLALVLGIFVSPVSAFLSSYEVAGLYERSGRPAPVSALTGLWYFPGMFILIGPFIWFIRTNNALNEYWVSLGADPTPRL